MPIITNKVGGHKNEAALRNVVRYITGSRFYKTGNTRGILGNSAQDIIKGFDFTKQMYDKEDGKQVSHIIIGTHHEGIIEDELTEIAETALDYFYEKGFQCCYALHGGSYESPGYTHVHMAVNTVNFKDGKRLYETYGVTSALKNHLAERFDSYDWSSVNDKSPDWKE